MYEKDVMKHVAEQNFETYNVEKSYPRQPKVTKYSGASLSRGLWGPETRPAAYMGRGLISPSFFKSTSIIAHVMSAISVYLKGQPAQTSLKTYIP